MPLVKEEMFQGVTAKCDYPGCGWVWPVDPSDPRVATNGPWDCGNNHRAAYIFDRSMAQLHVRHGLRWGTVTGKPVKGGPSP